MEEEIDTIQRNDRIEEVLKELVKKRRAESVFEVLEEVEVLIDMRFFKVSTRQSLHRFLRR